MEEKFDSYPQAWPVDTLMAMKKGGLNSYANVERVYRQGVDVLNKKESVRKRTV